MASYISNKPTSQIRSAFDGMSVKNVYSSNDSHRQILFSQQETFFNPHLVCKKGTSNIDNICVCQGSVNSAPFNMQMGHMRELFVPERSVDFPYPNPSIQCLMDARGPYAKKYMYEPALGTCEYGARCM